MTRFITPVVFIALCGFTANLATAQDDAPDDSAKLVISSGLENGGYWNAAERLIAVGADIGLAVENERSTGSVNNLRALADANNPVSLAFAQADALQYFLKDNPDFEKSVEILQRVGEECVYIISHESSKLRTDKDMQEKRLLNLGIRSPNSGIRVTFDYMAELVPEFKKLAVSYGDTVDMMENFVFPHTDVEAVMTVHGPNEMSPEIIRVLASPKQFQFVKIRDKRLLEMNYRGNPIYQSKKVKPGAIDDARAVETICVQGLFLGNRTKLSEAQRDKLETVITDRWAEVHLKEK